jgi:hypothetical protein
MKTIQRTFWVHLALAVVFLAGGLFWKGIPVMAVFALLMGAVWFAAQRNSGPSLEGLVVIVLVVLCGYSLFQGTPAWLMVLAIVFIIGAWDLNHFTQRLKAVDVVAYDTGIGKNHLARLALIEGVGVVLGGLAATVQMNLPFWWEAAFVFLAVIGLNRLIQFLRHPEEEEKA